MVICAIWHLTNSSQRFPPITVDDECIFCHCSFKVHCAITVKIWRINIVVHPSTHSTAHPYIPAPTCQYIHLTVYPFDHPSLHLSILYPFTYPFDHASTHLPLWSSIHPTTNQSIHAPTIPHPPFLIIHPSIHQSTHPSSHPSCIHSRPFDHPSIHPSIHPSQIIGKKKAQRIREEKQVTIHCRRQDHHREL